MSDTVLPIALGATALGGVGYLAVRALSKPQDAPKYADTTFCANADPNSWSPGSLACGFASAVGVVSQPAADAGAEVAKSASYSAALLAASGILVSGATVAVIVWGAGALGGGAGSLLKGIL